MEGTETLFECIRASLKGFHLILIFLLLTVLIDFQSSNPKMFDCCFCSCLLNM